jgi:hypothetical protein
MCVFQALYILVRNQTWTWSRAYKNTTHNRLKRNKTLTCSSFLPSVSLKPFHDKHCSPLQTQGYLSLGRMFVLYHFLSLWAQTIILLRDMSGPYQTVWVMYKYWSLSIFLTIRAIYFIGRVLLFLYLLLPALYISFTYIYTSHFTLALLCILGLWTLN